MGLLTPSNFLTQEEFEALIDEHFKNQPKEGDLIMSPELYARYIKFCKDNGYGAN